ncbi:MAG: CBS domain-containing protein [Oscillospiraceae bacterium]|nr:CBS domain-containing protein [Oscillospiraceae bacterium]
MNIAEIMIPKVCTVFLQASDSVRQGMEIITRHGYTAVPVLDGGQHYVGCITEGDLLRHIMAIQSTDYKVLEYCSIGSLVRRDFCPALPIDADEKTVIDTILNQNFVPIVDSRNALCGILTRRGIIAYLADRK